MTLARNVRTIRVLNAVAAGQTDQNGAVLDMANFDGVMFIAAFGTLATGAVTGLKAQQGQEANLADAADLAGSALDIAASDDNRLLVLDIFRPAERYVRAVVTRGTADAVIDCVIAIQYGPRRGPVSQDATVAGYETHVSPAEGTA
ncbi:hypothetical protein [Methylobrevis pamukkalensis]|uniref:Uncharacterized protein n=1 Tax=Methylobrevis pamukkalensis TaxID=1439726 RepID=A0A1E3GWF5_9HYPH|nr:hypothetical protein [Methylobrevis pamukkalensis]ODN68409.1 hypothetical protein A6302_04294 [Methylobrevis pamukkalensis]